MEIRARDINRELLLEFSGEMDHHGARNALKEVEMAIDAALPQTLILDFSGVTFMDSSGIGVLAGRYRKISCFGGKVYVIHANRRIRKILEMSGIGDIVEMIDQEEKIEKQ